MVKAREIGEQILREHPDSFAGHYVLGVAIHYGEGDLARSVYHLDISAQLFEKQHGGAARSEAPWRWHEATLQELASTLGEMDRPARRAGDPRQATTRRTGPSASRSACGR